MRSFISVTSTTTALFCFFLMGVVDVMTTTMTVNAFVVVDMMMTPQPLKVIGNQRTVVFTSRTTSTTTLFMADEPLPQDRMGETERLLLEHRRIQDLGLVQELGRTIKKDGLDGIRAMVWMMYNVSNVVFPIMGTLMMAGICLNMIGYGYYWDPNTHQMMIDTLEHIRQENMYQQELWKIAVNNAAAADTKTNYGLF